MDRAYSLVLDTSSFTGDELEQEAGQRSGRASRVVSNLGS